MKLETILKLTRCLEFWPGQTVDDTAGTNRARIVYDGSAGTLKASVAGGSAGPDLATHPRYVNFIQIEDLSAGADIAARAEFMAPSTGCTIKAIGIIPKGSSTGIDNSNTAVIAVADADANSIVSKTYNTAAQPPAASAYETLGTISAHGVLTANEVVTVAVTQGAAADLPACILAVEWALV